MMEVLLYLALTTAMVAGTARLFVEHNARSKQTRFAQQITDIADKVRSALYGRDSVNTETFKERLAELGVDFDDPWGGKIDLETRNDCIVLLAENLSQRDCVAASAQIKSDCVVSSNGVKMKYKTQAGEFALQGGDGIYAGECSERGGNKVLFFFAKR